ncbi:MAG: NAD(P)-dependent alcohol dehydrogenase [Polyangiales bacterium]
MIVATSPSARVPLQLVELPSRPLRENELRVKVRAIGVNPVDWKMRGLSPLGLAQRLLGPSGPLVVGTDFSGEVVERGAAVTARSVGDRVVGGTDFSRGQLGSYADEVVVREDQCALLPDEVSYEDAACLPVPAVTAWICLTRVGGLTPGRDAKALILGASGGVGLFAVQLARNLGAKVVGVCSGRNVARVEALGAAALDYAGGDVLERAKALGPYDIIVNAVGSDHYPLAALRALRSPTGSIAMVVVSPWEFPSIALDPRVKSVLGRPTRETLEPLVKALARKEIETLIEEVFPLAEAERAQQRSREGKVVGKLLLRPG